MYNCYASYEGIYYYAKISLLTYKKTNILFFDKFNKSEIIYNFTIYDKNILLLTNKNIKIYDMSDVDDLFNRKPKISIPNELEIYNVPISGILRSRKKKTHYKIKNNKVIELDKLEYDLYYHDEFTDSNYIMFASYHNSFEKYDNIYLNI